MMARALASMSWSDVDHPEMLIRMAGRPCQLVGPHQQVPSACTASIMAAVRSSVSPRTST